MLPLGLLAVGCPSGGSLEDPDRFLNGGVGGFGGGSGPGEVCDAPEIVFKGTTCATDGCHGSGDSLDLASDGVAERLLDVPADASGSCAESGGFLIDSSDAEESLMLKKVLNTQDCGLGMPLPYSENNKLSDENIECLRSWIDGVIAEGAGGTGSAGAAGTETSSDDGTMSQAPTALTIEAECIFDASQPECANLTTASHVGLQVSDGDLGYATAGDTATYEGVDFTGYDELTVRYGKGNATPGTVEFRLDSATGTVIASLVDPAGTGAWTTYETETLSLTGITGTHDLWLTFTANDVANIDSMVLSASAAN